jgi:integrase
MQDLTPNRHPRIRKVADGFQEYLFHHPSGERMLRRDRVFARITKETGIKITAKDLRDYFATTIATGSDTNKPDIVTVSKLLGHTNLATTQKYLVSMKEARQKAVKVLDDADRISTGSHNISTGEGVTPNLAWVSNWKIGSGEGIRTPDTANMSRML